MSELLSVRPSDVGIRGHTPDGVTVESQAGGPLGRVGIVCGGSLGCAATAVWRSEVIDGGSDTAPTETIAFTGRGPGSNDRVAVLFR